MKRLRTGLGVVQTRVPEVADGVGLISGDYASAFGLELARELIGLTTSIYEPADTLQLQRTVLVIGSQMPLAAFILLMVNTMLYWYELAGAETAVIPLTAFCMAFHILERVSVYIIAITCYATSSIWRTPYVSLVQARMTDPLTLALEAYGPSDPSRSWKSDADDMFDIETDADRLYVGPHLENFGVSKTLPRPLFAQAAA